MTDNTADLVGQQLGNYRLVRLLGQGGFADVYLGQHVHLNTSAALPRIWCCLLGKSVSSARVSCQSA